MEALKTRHICCVAFIGLIASAIGANDCPSFVDSRGRSSVDFAPLPGYTDVCSRDFQLCVSLTQGYPPSTQTIGYFVSDAEWQDYQKGKPEGFGRYLIAQRGRTLSSDQFVDFKRYVRSQQGDIEDHTKLPSVFESQGHVSLGVVDEAEDMIAMGAILKLTQTNPPPERTYMLASINIVLELKGRRCRSMFSTP